MMTFTLNPPRRGKVRRRRVARKSKGSRSASTWRSLVKRYGVKGAVKMRRRRRTAARKAKVTRTRKAAVARRSPVARRRRSRKSSRRRVRVRRVRRSRSRRRVRRNPVGAVANPPVRRRRRRRARRNTWFGQPGRHARAAKKGWRKRRSRRRVSRRRRFARRPYRVRRYYRGRKLRGSRKQVRARRRNIRKALNKRYGKRHWRKWSHAKWNPGFALSIGGVTRSISGVFSVEMLKDGLAVAGGIVGTLALPAMLQRILPSALTARVSLTSGWSGHVANFASAGLVGYAAGLVLGGNVGRKVLYGGLGAAVAKLLLDKVPGLSARTGVTLSGNAELDKLIEQEIAAELAAGGGSGVGAYMTPGTAVAALPLGDYVGPRDVVGASALGGGEFDNGEEF